MGAATAGAPGHQTLAAVVQALWVVEKEAWVQAVGRLVAQAGRTAAEQVELERHTAVDRVV